jgi:uracil phosphoribosyltransferase
MLEHIHVLSHPLVNTRLVKLREASTSPKEFREVKSTRLSKLSMSLIIVPQGIHELSIMLGYEASRDLEEITVQGVNAEIINPAGGAAL